VGFMVLPDDEEEEYSVGQRIVGVGKGHRLGALGRNIEPAASALSGQKPMQLPQGFVAAYLKNRMDTARPQAAGNDEGFRLRQLQTWLRF